MSKPPDYKLTLTFTHNGQEQKIEYNCSSLSWEVDRAYLVKCLLDRYDWLMTQPGNWSHTTSQNNNIFTPEHTNEQS